MIIIIQTIGGGRRAPLRRHALGQQHQQRGAAGTDPQADEEEGEHRQREAGVALAWPIQAVAIAASVPPAASTTMPPRIHGVQRPLRSEPKPIRGRVICTA
jgi:hypothetical protein